MKPTIGKITREQALALNGDYVASTEPGNTDRFGVLMDKVVRPHFMHDSPKPIRKGQLVLAQDPEKSGFIVAKVSSVNSRAYGAEDGPIVRVTDGKYSWRVDGDTYCVPLEE